MIQTTLFIGVCKRLYVFKEEIGLRQRSASSGLWPTCGLDVLIIRGLYQEA